MGLPDRGICITFARKMSKAQRETITIRTISSFFTVLALAAFKPFGLDLLQWVGYVHLLAMGLLGIVACAVTEAILKYIVKKPRSLDRGVDYIIRRNLWFQFINTPLVALLICLYRNYAMSNGTPGNVLSWSNFFETLLIIAFCSFAIGLYWRFKFRSCYLAIELEETRLLNEQLKAMQAQAESRVQSLEAAINQPCEDLYEQLSESVTLTGTTSDKITLNIDDLLFIETVGNYVKVHHLRDNQVRTDMLRATSKQMEDHLHSYPMVVRCHRAFLVNLAQMEQIVTKAGSMQLIVKHSHESIPVSRSNVSQIKEAISIDHML